MKVKWLVGALVVLVVLNVALIGTFLFAHFHGGRHGGWHGGREGRMHRWMADQPREERQKLFRAMQSFHEEVKPIADETDRLEADLIKSMGEDPVPRAHIDSLLTQISAKRLEVARRATDRMIALGDSLSSDEREHLMKALMRMHRGPRGLDGKSFDDKRSRH